MSFCFVLSRSGINSGAAVSSCAHASAHPGSALVLPTRFINVPGESDVAFSPSMLGLLTRSGLRPKQDAISLDLLNGIKEGTVGLARYWAG